MSVLHPAGLALDTQDPREGSHRARGIPTPPPRRKVSRCELRCPTRCLRQSGSPSPVSHHTSSSSGTHKWGAPMNSHCWLTARGENTRPVSSKAGVCVPCKAAWHTALGFLCLCPVCTTRQRQPQPGGRDIPPPACTSQTKGKYSLHAF